MAALPGMPPHDVPIDPVFIDYAADAGAAELEIKRLLGRNLPGWDAVKPEDAKARAARRIARCCG